MAEGNQFLIQLIFTRCIYEFLLHGSGTIYFISILLNEKEKKTHLMPTIVFMLGTQRLMKYNRCFQEIHSLVGREIPNQY